MQIIRKIVPNNFNLFLIGDQHIGSILSSSKLWIKMIHMVNSEVDGINPRNNFVVDHGDMLEAIDVQDKRFDISTVGGEDENGNPVRDLRMAQILNQAQKAVLDRQDIRKNLITILKGNHEQKLLRHGNYVKDYVCERLGIEYGTYSCVIEYVDRKDRLLFKHYAHHGFGSIKSIAHPSKRRHANRKISLMQKFDAKFGDCLLSSMGHTHQLIICDPEPVLYMETKDGKIEQRYTKPSKTTGYIEPNHRWIVNTGSFLKTFGIGFDGYGERAGYDPIELGFILVKIRERKIDKVEKVV